MLGKWNCYVLALKLRCSVRVRISRKTVEIEPGVYFYVGSSKGRGGAIARLTRHLLKNKRIHWHVDQLTTSECCEVIGFYLLNSNCVDCELCIAKAMAKYLDYTPYFGSTDKPRSPSHLFKCRSAVDQCVYLAYELLNSLGCVRSVIYGTAL